MLCKKVSLHQLLVGIFIFMLIWINIDLAFQILPNGDKYIEGKWVVFILACSRLFNSSFSIGTSILGYSRYYYMSLIFTALLTVSAILLNIYLIPIFGINGSALSNLISYVIYFSLLLLLVKWKIGTSPFSLPQLKTLAIFIMLFLLNILWRQTIYPLFGSMPFKPEINAITDGIIKTLVFGGIAVVSIYLSKVSEEVNHIADKTLKRIK